MTANIERQEELKAFQQCLEEIGSDFVEAFRIVKLDQVSPGEAAERLNVKRVTVDSRVFKGRQQIADCVEKKLQ